MLAKMVLAIESPLFKGSFSAVAIIVNLGMGLVWIRKSTEDTSIVTIVSAELAWPGWTTNPSFERKM
jgi:hypothetical protein